jgi:hypothetical protein
LRGNVEQYRAAIDLGDAARVLAGFSLFHGLLLGEVQPPSAGGTCFRV